MKYYSLFFASLVIILLTVFSSCDKKEKEDPIIPNEEELITSLYYTLVDTLTNDTIVFSFKDIDGDGGNDPVITNADLQANINYIAFIELYNESVDPRESISEEVKQEDDHHQFFFIYTPGLNVTIEYADSDDNGNPLGLESSLSAGEISNGELTIILRHSPDKNALGVSDGLIENAGGETDIEVTFDITLL